MERSLRDPERTAWVLGPDGSLAPGHPTPDVDLVSLWSNLFLARVADELFAQLALPRFASAKGEEAILATLAARLGSDDWVYPGIRDRALPLLRGVQMQEMVAQLRGSELAETKGRLGQSATTSHLAAVACPTQSLAMHLPLAAGHARALSLTHSGAVVVAICGEGLSCHGRFHEALALAASSKLPLLIVVKRPLWAKEPPLEAGRLGQGPAARAQALGLYTKQAHGADCLGTLSALDDCLSHIRDRNGAAVLEVEYTPLYEDSPKAQDPLERLQTYLIAQDRITPAQIAAQRQSIADAFNAAVASFPTP